MNNNYFIDEKKKSLEILAQVSLKWKTRILEGWELGSYFISLDNFKHIKL